MNNAVDVALAKAVHELRIASPPAWDMFMQAMAAHLDEVTEACISAPPEALPERQGRAREIRDLFRALAHGPVRAAQLAEKERINGPRRQP